MSESAIVQYPKPTMQQVCHYSYRKLITELKKVHFLYVMPNSNKKSQYKGFKIG